MKSIKKFWVAVILSGLILIAASGIIAVARPQPQPTPDAKYDAQGNKIYDAGKNTGLSLDPQQKEIVREGRLAEYIAANYGGRGEITIEQADAFCHHLSSEFNIPYVYFTQGGCDPLNETI